MHITSDPLTGAETVIVAGRQSRPNLPERDCPFCPGGIEAPEPYSTRWFTNRWPSMPDGRCEVHLFSPDHDAALGSLGPAGVERVLDLWTDRSAAHGARAGVDYVLVFENRGAEVGATISHPHGQLYAYPGIPPVPRRELAGQGPCPLCSGPAPGLTVVEHGTWRAWVPEAAAYPYEMLIAPGEHAGDLAGAAATFPAASVVVGTALGALDRHFAAAAPYMLWVHQRPTDGGRWPRAHLHIHVTPLWRSPGVTRYVAGAELGAGILFNPVAPAEAAASLRAAT